MATSLLHPRSKVMVNLTAECYDHGEAFSSGIWMSPQESILQHSFFRFNVQIICYVYLAYAFHFFLGRYGVPKLSSDILAGFVLGPTFSEKFFSNAASMVFNSIEGPFRSPNVLMVALAKIGFVFFAFLTAVRMDPTLVRRMGRQTIILGILMAAFPVLLLMCIDVKCVQGSFMCMRWSMFVQMFTGMMINSQFMGVSQILFQLKISNSKVGHIALAAQLITELLRFSIVALSGFKDEWIFVKKITAVHSFTVFSLLTSSMVFGVRPLLYYFIRMTPEGQPVNNFYITVVVIFVLASAFFSELVGVFFTYGPFVIGLLIPSGSPLARDVIATTERIVSGTFIPILMTFCASKFDFIWFWKTPTLIFDITLFAFFFKVLGSFILSMVCCKLSPREATAFALILNYKGVLEIGTLLNFGNLEYKDVGTTSGSLFVLMFSSVMPPLVKFLYDPAKQYIGYEKKSVQDLEPGAEFNILACAHRQEDAMAAVKLLSMTTQSKENRLSVYGLCLEELVASSTPVLIDHQLHQKTVSEFGSRSQPSLDIFNYFGGHNSETIEVSLFTAISHLGQMHEDICRLAFNKAITFIVVPFHMKWNSKTKRFSQCSNEIRILNVEVLNRAPCSVGILIDRRESQGLSSVFVQTTQNIVKMIFIGGEDDREALAYSMKMAGNFRVDLTVIRCRFAADNAQDSWEEILDNEAFRKLKQQMAGSNNICLNEVNIADGAAIASLVHELESCSDLIVVGRRHDDDHKILSQLSQWTEFGELGPMGDMLASEDIKSAVSVLVVQNQIMKAENSSLLNGSRVF